MMDVLIIGAGPTGLFFALECMRFGLSFRIIDQKDGPSIHSKALAIHARTLEILEKMDLIEIFLEKGLKVDEMFYHFEKKKLQFELEGLDTRYPYILVLPQSETERIFIQHIEEKKETIEWQTRLLDVIENKALIEKPNGQKEVVQARWIIGCDGAHSVVRKSLKFPFKGVKFPEEFLLADVIAESESKNPHFFINRKGLAVILPLPRAHSFRLIFPNPKAEEPTRFGLMQLLKERGCDFRFEISEDMWISKFNIQRRIVPQFRHENIFLAGDAAHIHSPVGGQGMNTSIQDAYNLAWKIAFVTKGASSDTLLDTYNMERFPVAEKVLKGTSRATKGLTFCQKYFPSIVYLFFRFILSKKKRKTALGVKLSELDVHYRESPIVKEVSTGTKWHGPKAGDRAPDVELEEGRRLFELLKSPYFHLLLFEDNASFAHVIQEEYGSWISVHVVKGEKIREKYHAGPKTIYLIRPDGYIGYRSRSYKMEEIIAYLLRIFKPASLRSKS